MGSPVQVLTTDRLLLRHLDPEDAPFILRLLNEPSWLQNIGDRGVRTIADAQRYIATGPAEMYARLGFGLFLVCLAVGNEPVGICGLLKREALEDVDLGFASCRNTGAMDMPTNPAPQSSHTPGSHSA
jgi:ribosomal-protein-alanine N-acetyltransferase